MNALRCVVCGILTVGAAVASGCGQRAGGVNVFAAVEADDASSIRQYAGAGGDLNVKNFSGETPLWCALVNNRRESFEALLECGADPNIVMTGRRVVTHWAAMNHDDADWLTLLLSHGADPNLINHGSGRPSEGPPLCFAIGGDAAYEESDGLLKNVKLLVENGADIEIEWNGRTALEHAEAQCRFRVVLYLLEQGADYQRPNSADMCFRDRMKHRFETRNEALRLQEDRNRVEAIHAWLTDRSEPK